MRRAATLAVTSVLLGVAACTSPTAVDETELLRIEDVVVIMAQSSPPQVSVRVQGALPDGCSSVDAVSQRRDGTTITVTITVRRAGQACALVIRTVEQTVRLDGTFPPGDYVVRVNGVERRFRI